MAIVSAEKFVQAARDNGYAVGGFNLTTLNGLKLSCVQQKLKKLQFLSKLQWVLLNTWVVTKYVNHLFLTL